MMHTTIVANSMTELLKQAELEYMLLSWRYIHRDKGHGETFFTNESARTGVLPIASKQYKSKYMV